MKRRVIIILCMVVLAASFLAMLAFERRAGRYYTQDVVVVTPRIADVRYNIHRGMPGRLDPHFPEHNIVGVTRNRQELTTEYRSAVVWMYHTCPGYFDLRRMDFAEGSAVYEHGGMVINEALAWQLFGNTTDLAGLEIYLRQEVYTVRGIVNAGSEPTAWRIALTEPITALYIRANEHDPLAAATAQHIARGFLFINPNNYYFMEIDRIVQSIGIRARILLTVMLIVMIVLAMLRARRMPWLFAVFAAAAVLFVLTMNGIIAWLPNPEAISTGIFSYIFNPHSPPQIARLSAWANVMFGMGAVSLLLGAIAANSQRPNSSQSP